MRVLVAITHRLRRDDHLVVVLQAIHSGCPDTAACGQTSDDKGIDALFECQRETLGSALDDLVR